jgi:hypothetical protein
MKKLHQKYFGSISCSCNGNKIFVQGVIYLRSRPWARRTRKQSAKVFPLLNSKRRRSNFARCFNQWLINQYKKCMVVLNYRTLQVFKTYEGFHTFIKYFPKSIHHVLNAEYFAFNFLQADCFRKKINGFVITLLSYQPFSGRSSSTSIVNHFWFWKWK